MSSKTTSIHSESRHLHEAAPRDGVRFERPWLLGLVMASIMSVSGQSVLATEEIQPIPDQPVLDVQLSLGEIAMAGKACALDESLSTVVHENSSIVVNVATLVSKQAGEGLARGACTWALPIQIPAGYKLKIDRIETEGLMSIAKGAQINGAMEVFTTGSEESASIEFNGKSARYNKTVRQGFSQEADIETDCGAGINLRSNSSFIIRNGERDSHALFAGLLLSYKLEKCE